MDDISRKGAISKKTMYKSFEDKNQLVERLVTELLACFRTGLEQARQAANAIEEVALKAINQQLFKREK